MTKTDLSTEALMARKVLAEQATPGPWFLAEEDDDLLITSESRNGMVDIAKCEMANPDAGMDEPFASEQKANAYHIAANDPDTVIATIDELLRLRKQVEGLTNIRDIQLQEMAVDMLNEVSHDKTGEDIKAFSLGATCPHCNMQFATMREAIEHDAACPKHPATIRAERLEKEADWLAENCSRLEREANWLAGSLPIGAHGSCDDARKRWRDVARKAVEEKL